MVNVVFFLLISFLLCLPGTKFPNAKSLEKKCKKVMDRCIRIHRKKMRQKIHNLRSTNPKEYWKIINSGQRSCLLNLNLVQKGYLIIVLTH
jgi:hypothetical protein